MNKRRGRPANADPVQTAILIARLRELVKTHSQSEVARRLGISQPLVNLVVKGIRHKNTGAIVLNDLGLKRSDKLCRRCGERAILVTKSAVCLTCEVLELVKLGLVNLLEGEPDEPSIGGR